MLINYSTPINLMFNKLYLLYITVILICLTKPCTSLQTSQLPYLIFSSNETRYLDLNQYFT